MWYKPFVAIRSLRSARHCTTVRPTPLRTFQRLSGEASTIVFDGCCCAYDSCCCVWVNVDSRQSFVASWLPLILFVGSDEENATMSGGMDVWNISVYSRFVY